MKTIKTHKEWYDFGCNTVPKQVEKGMLPVWPYRVFDTYEECLKHIIKRTITKI